MEIIEKHHIKGKPVKEVEYNNTHQNKVYANQPFQQQQTPEQRKVKR